MEGKLIVVPPDAPNRCQNTGRTGQCFYATTEGTSFCPMHAGTAQDAIEKTKVRNYQFQRYKQRIDEKADSEVIKSLREEVGILRMVMEEIVNRCKDDTELLIYSPRITDLALKIEKVVVSAHKLETSLGLTLDKTSILNIATRIVNIVSQHVNDENTINDIVNEIGKMINE
jgi:Flp pilus assembly CpaF family ATPase